MSFARVGLLAITALAVVPSTAEAVRLRQGAGFTYDGRWAVFATPERGNCDRTYSFPFGIRGGALTYIGSEPVQVSGHVAPNGVLRGALAYSGAQASVSGRLSPTGYGSGRWSSSGSLTCTGRWSAQKTS
jgi:hypothetical protein